MTVNDAHNHPDWHARDLPISLGDENCYGTVKHQSPYLP